MLPRKFVPIPCGNPGRLYRRVTPEYLITKIKSTAVHFEFIVEVNVNGAVIRALYGRLDVAVLYPWEDPLGDEDIVNLKTRR